MTTLMDIAPEFSFVLDRGMRHIAGRYDPETFGNAEVILEGAVFSLRFFRDRGETFVEIGDQVSGWNDLDCVLDFLDQLREASPSVEERNMEASAKQLEAHWSELLMLLADPDRRRQLGEFCKSKAAERIRSIFPDYKGG